MSKILKALTVCDYSQPQPIFLSIGSLCKIDKLFCPNWNKAEAFKKCFVRKAHLAEII